MQVVSVGGHDRWAYDIAWDQPLLYDDMLSAAPAPVFWQPDCHTSQEMRPAFVSPDERYQVIATWEGTFHLDMPDTTCGSKDTDEPDDLCYHHICDIDTFIARLIAMKVAALDVLGSFG